MTSRVDYIENLINEIKISEISMFRDVAYSRALAVIDAFYGFNDIGIGLRKGLREEAHDAFSNWGKKQ